MPDGQQEPARSSKSRGRVLVAEDEPHIRRVLLTLLESAAFDTDVVSDGAAALNLLLGDTRYDIVLLDLMMPRASGLEILERVKDLKHRRRTPMVVLTAKGQDADRNRAYELGASDFVTKPFSPKKLLARIDELLEQA
ncbi:MAG: response regulator [Gemmatimonadota bacterium]